MLEEARGPGRKSQPLGVDGSKAVRVAQILRGLEGCGLEIWVEKFWLRGAGMGVMGAGFQGSGR